MNTEIIISIGLVILIMGILYLWIFGDFFSGIFQSQSLSIRDIDLLKRSPKGHDAGSFIKEFYDFKYKNISTCLKGTASVFATLVASFAKLLFEDKTYTFQKTSDIWLLILAGLLLIVNWFLVYELRAVNREYAEAIFRYES